MPRVPEPKLKKESIRRKATERPRTINELAKVQLALEIEGTYGKSNLGKLYFALAITPRAIEEREAFAKTLDDPVKKRDMLAILKTAREYRERLY